MAATLSSGFLLGLTLLGLLELVAGQAPAFGLDQWCSLSSNGLDYNASQPCQSKTNCAVSYFVSVPFCFVSSRCSGLLALAF